MKLIALAIIALAFASPAPQQKAPPGGWAYSPIGTELPCTEVSCAPEVLTVAQCAALEAPEYQRSRPFEK